MKSISRRAFTLLDLTGVIACLSLAAIVVLPSLRANRAASQGEVSRSNLKQLIRAHAAYTIAHQDRWLNPFNPTTSYGGSAGGADPEWYSIRVPSQPGSVWRLDDAGIQTEMYSVYWASASRQDILGGDVYSTVQFDPRDSETIARFNQIDALPGNQIGQFIWSSSYMYSPTMWFNPARYAGAARLTPTSPAQLGGVRSVRYNTVAETTYPSQKVVLFSRADFDQVSRTNANGQPVQLPPQWNNAAAIPDAAFADGSVDEVSIRKQQNAINAGSSWLTPTTPAWNVSALALENAGLGTSWENGQNNTTAWPAFFWGTRGGVAGRDVMPR